jgi:hypothetical protein
MLSILVSGIEWCVNVNKRNKRMTLILDDHHRVWDGVVGSMLKNKV